MGYKGKDHGPASLNYEGQQQPLQQASVFELRVFAVCCQLQYLWLLDVKLNVEKA